MFISCTNSYIYSCDTCTFKLSRKRSQSVFAEYSLAFMPCRQYFSYLCRSKRNQFQLKQKAEVFTRNTLGKQVLKNVLLLTCNFYWIYLLQTSTGVLAGCLQLYWPLLVHFNPANPTFTLCPQDTTVVFLLRSLLAVDSADI